MAANGRLDHRELQNQQNQRYRLPIRHRTVYGIRPAGWPEPYGFATSSSFRMDAKGLFENSGKMTYKTAVNTIDPTLSVSQVSRGTAWDKLGTKNGLMVLTSVNRSFRAILPAVSVSRVK
jgi:hypothetical protein